MLYQLVLTQFFFFNENSPLTASKCEKFHTCIKFPDIPVHVSHYLRKLTYTLILIYGVIKSLNENRSSVFPSMLIIMYNKALLYFPEGNDRKKNVLNTYNK